MTRKPRANLPAPYLQDVVNYGGIARVNVYPPPERGTIVTITALSLVNNDEIRLFWQDPVTPALVRKVENVSDALLDIHVPADILARYPIFPPVPPYKAAQVEVWYDIYRPFPEETFSSDRTLVTVDWMVPGGLDPNPNTPYINDNLPKLVLPDPIPQGQAVTFGVARWENIEPGDRLYVRWGSRTLLGAIVTDNLGQTGPDIAVTVPWAEIDAAGDRIAVTYYILDVVSNHSLNAPEVFPEIETSNRLPRPTFERADDFGAIPGDEAARVKVAYEKPTPATGDIVTLHWSGTTAEGIGVPERTLRFDWPTPPPIQHTFAVDLAWVQALEGGVARAWYTVNPANGGPLLRSNAAQATVTGNGLSLPAPTVREAVGAELDPEGTATVVIRTDYGFARPTDRIIMYWRGKDFAGKNVDETQAGEVADAVADQLAFGIPQPKLAAIAGGTVTVSYDVVAEGNTVVPSPTATWRVRAASGEVRLPAPSVDGTAADGTLDPANVPGDISVRVPANTAFLPGDEVRVRFVGALGTSYEGAYVTADVNGTALTVPRSYLLVNVGYNIVVSYEWKRGVTTKTSDSRTIAVIEDSAGTFPAPVVPEAKGTGSILPGDAAQGITVTIPNDAIIRPTDPVTVTIRSATGTYTDTATGAKSFKIAAAALFPFIDTNIVVGYTVKRDGVDTKSDELSLAFRGFADRDPQLARPALLNATGTVLDLASFTGDATVTVAPWPLMAAGQPVRLEAIAGPGNPVLAPIDAVVTAADVAIGMRLALPRSWLSTLRDASSLDLAFTVTFDPKRPSVTTRFPASLTYLVYVARPSFGRPSVPQAPTGVLDGSLASATLEVPANAGLQAGDSVTGYFGTCSLGTQPAVPGAALSFPITGAMIVAMRGKQFSCHYDVQRNGTVFPSADLPLSVSKEWTYEYDFESAAPASARVKEQIKLSPAMDVHFYRGVETRPPQAPNTIAVEDYAHSDPAYYDHRLLRLGAPEDISHDTTVIIEFYKTWKTVRLGVTSVDRAATFGFEDEDEKVFQTVTVPAGSPTRGYEVRCDAPAGKRIKYIMVKANDVIRLDMFKFKE